MATTFDWNIANLERETADGVVYNVHFNVVATNDAYSASSYGSVPLNTEGAATRNSFVPYLQLTPEVVEGWLKNALGEEQIEALETRLQAQLDEQAAPTRATGTPWSETESAPVTQES